MMSSVGWRRDDVWSEGTGGNNPWGRSFKIKWLQLNDLPFQKTLHLKNPLNQNKPVKISRDCQVLVMDFSFYVLPHAWREETTKRTKIVLFQLLLFWTAEILWLYDLIVAILPGVN